MTTKYHGMTAGKNADKRPKNTHSVNTYMSHVLLRQAADLLIKHVFRLGNKDDAIAQLTVLGEKTEPGHPGAILPVSGIEHELGFIDDKEYATLLDLTFFSIPVRERELFERFRRKSIVWHID